MQPVAPLVKGNSCSGGIDHSVPDELIIGDSYESTSRRSTHFLFHHKLFTMTGAVFRMGEDSVPLLEVRLGENKAQIPLKAALAEFSLDAKGQADTEMLDQVTKGLRYVREIRPGDSIPRELLDGTASWTVQPKHTMIARGRITMQLVSWMTGEEAVIFDLGKLEQIVEDPLTRRRVNEAVAEICKMLGIPIELRQTVIDQVDQMAHELSFIEALRDYAGGVKRILDKVNQFSRVYDGDKSFYDDLQRIKSLMKKPLTQIETYFLQADAQTAEIIPALRNMKSTINFIRDIRDEIHGALMNWEDHITTIDELHVERSRPNEAVLRKFYGFLARNFPESREWPLFSKQIRSNAKKARNTSGH